MRNHIITFSAGLVLPLAIASSLALSQPKSTVYASVVATKLFVVGAANPQTGLFYQSPGDDTTWQHTGPTNIRNFNVAVFGPSHGRTLYIASGNGVHKTTDGGATWKNTAGWEVTEVLWVCPDPHNADVAYCATPYGIFKTVDGCNSWKAMNKGLKALFTQCVIVDHANSNKVYCAAEDGAYASEDAGASWHRLGLSVGGVRVIVQHPKDPAILFAGTEEYGIYVSRNGGKWWERSEAGVNHSTFYTIAFDQNNPDVMYAAGYVTGVYKSVDGGRSWAQKNEGMMDISIHGLAVDPTNSDRVYAATFWKGIYRTDNGGTLWHQAGLAGSEVWNVIIQPN